MGENARKQDETFMGDGWFTILIVEIVSQVCTGQNISNCTF